VVDGRSDLYSLGLTAYYAATGRVAVTGESTQKILVRQLTERITPIETLRPDLPPALARAIDRCVEKEPSDRFATAEALVEEIDAAQLVEREIPLSIRLFAGDLSTLSHALVAIGVVIWLLVETQRHSSVSSVDAMLPVVGLLAILFTRALTTMSEGRRLAVAGYSVDDVMQGLGRVMDERMTRRAELRADPETQQRRRTTLKWAAFMLVAAVVMIWASLQTRIRVTPTTWATPPKGIALVFSGFALLGTSLVLLFKSPFRSSPPERLFRLVWLGPIGRGFVRASMRGVKTRRGATAPARAVPIIVPVARGAAVKPGVVAPDGLSALSARIEELERWRRSRGE
jgi:hypothetical protein